MAVVPLVKRISQMSSPWMTTSGSVCGWSATSSVKVGLPVTAPPPMAMVAPTASPVLANAASARGHSSASTIANARLRPG